MMNEYIFDRLPNNGEKVKIIIDDESYDAIFCLNVFEIWRGEIMGIYFDPKKHKIGWKKKNN